MMVTCTTELLRRVMDASPRALADIAMREIRLAEDRFWKGMKDLSYGLAQIDKVDIQELYRNHLQMVPAVADFIQKSKWLKGHSVKVYLQPKSMKDK